jgi:hypothetical protein
VILVARKNKGYTKQHMQFLIQDGFSFSTTPMQLNDKKRKRSKLNDNFVSSEGVLKEYMSSLSGRLSRALPSPKAVETLNSQIASCGYDSSPIGFQESAHHDPNALGMLTLFNPNPLLHQ